MLPTVQTKSEVRGPENPWIESRKAGFLEQSMVRMCEEWCLREEKWKIILISSVEANLKFPQIPTCLTVRWVTTGFSILLSGWFMSPYEGYSISNHITSDLELGCFRLISAKHPLARGLCAQSSLSAGSLCYCAWAPHALGWQVLTQAEKIKLKTFKKYIWSLVVQQDGSYDKGAYRASEMYWVLWGEELEDYKVSKFPSTAF